MRNASIDRQTKETSISLELSLDGNGKYDIEIPVNFLSHMLELFSFHSGIDLSIKASGDVEVDFHHTVEDIGICLGKCIKEALADKVSITRYGFFILPMDEARAVASVDISGRPFFLYQGPPLIGKTGDFDLQLIEEFFRAVVLNAGITLHVSVECGENMHHIAEAIFKAFARALAIAVKITDSKQVPSSKGVLE